ncbi:MAG: hypothetical protein Q7J29_03015 [Stagnimonas sp.]|nr:hypothetical protein [Stagnimonas sp.]
MKQVSHLPRNAALNGWRARVWAWVLFLALFKGLIPHAALASVLMRGEPALVWCAPGAAAISSEGKSSASLPGELHACVCAAAADGALPSDPSAAVYGRMAPVQPSAVAAIASDAQPVWLPPVRGPPAL